MTLRTKVTALFLGIVTAGVLGTSLIATRLFVADKRDGVLELGSVAAANIASNLGSTLNHLQNQLAVLDTILQNTRRSGQDNALLKLAYHRLQIASELTVFDARGLVANIGTERVSSSLDASEAESLIQALGQRSGRFMMRRSQVESGSVYLFTAIGGKLYRVLLTPDFFRETFAPARALAVALVTGQEEIVARNSSGPTAVGIVRALDLREKNAVVAQESELPGGRTVLAAAAPVPYVDEIAVVLQAPATQVSAMISQVLRQSTPFFLGILILALLTGAVLSARIVKPLERLTRATAKIAAGIWKTDLEARSGNDEITQLVRAFRKMGDELSAREVELQKAHEKILRNERLAVLGQFGAGIAHEVKNPLNAVLGYAQLLNRKTPVEAEEDKKFLGFIMDETRRASKIITELLTFARQKPPSLAPQKVSDVVTYAKEVMSAQAAAAKVDLSLDLSDEGAQAAMDRDQMLQVLNNLITNAIHALEEKPEGQGRCIALQTHRAEDQIVVEVRDNGSGISPENLSKIFEPFFSTKKVGKGTGLGLAMCHGIIQQHGGKIEVTSELGSGTAFQIHLPLAASSELAAPPLQPGQGPGAS